jgi:hypothetical protein
MTVEQVKEQVKLIKAVAGDDEAAHSYEDALHEHVLKAIAKGAENAPELAKEALKTTKIDFARWCA